MADLVKLTEEGLIPKELAERMQAIKEIQDLLRTSSERRRRKKTPKGLRKSREIGGGKSIDYVDRAEYQRWLNEHFPGWYITDEKYWTDTTVVNGRTIPLLFNCSLTLHIVDEGLPRTIPGVGSMHVSESEITRNNTTLLAHKYGVAQTNAIKVACGWLDAFFDLRADDESRSEILTPPTDEQEAKFKELLLLVPDIAKDETKRRWGTQNKTSAKGFLEVMESKLKERSMQEQAPKP